jgi:hypothetical protein
MSCYRYKVINRTKTPILKNVDVLLVLTMEDNYRFNEDPFLLKLAKKTIIQYNKGFKKGGKPESIKSSCHDIVHANYTAFKYLKKYKNVIILEDDALVINNDIKFYNEIDSFIKDEKFDCFSFCSLGLFSKYNNNFFKLRKNKICTFGAAQAIIYSREARTMLIKKIIDNDFGNGHMDGYYINSLDNIFTYKYPLIAQIFPATENRKEWVFFDGSFPVYILILFIKILKLDTHPHAWNLVYFFYRNIFLLLVLILLLIRSLKNVKYVKQVKYLKLVQPKNIL